ncbi:DUF572-domain-containing protein [Jaminaea rosea]|uniref:Splicing factor YJU2 n=1 Tax=Jaminaea rosea TaxID=1569628 RepID=A0A316UNE5_9BASI|nr:DUF572-domain-containing protein [Jaminaea rosea]PWN26822.1 DUF572-domain-containing protein [Jaminaea rosea]
MAERKVLSKYYPPDFDPSKIKRVKRPQGGQIVVRLMAPFSMRCNSCGEYIYKGRKFNARKETVQGQDYYGIRIFRFYIKCTRCSAEITFKTDPRNTDYVAEHGASRNYEPWKEGKEQDEADGQAYDDDDDDPLAHFAEEERLRELEAQGKSREDAAAKMVEEGADPMALLEARQRESKREMEMEDNLRDIRSRNAKMDRVDAGDIMDRLTQKRAARDEERRRLDPEEEERRRAEEEDELLVRKYFSRAEDLGGEEEERELEAALRGGGAAADDDDDQSSATGPSSSASPLPPAANTSNGNGSGKAGVVVKRALADTGDDDTEPEVTSLLSERAKTLLGSTSASAASPPPLPMPAKKKAKKGNALGIVRKKVA